jgi:transforming growth factor-beta-induced protein
VLAAIDLSGPSALTLLGPTNDAFNLLDSALVTFLLSPEGLADLTGILNYHVLMGILTNNNVVDGPASTVEGGLVEVGTSPSLMFNNATVVEREILANNGVLFKINQVLDPNDSPVGTRETIIDFVDGNPNLTSLTAAVVRAGATFVEGLGTEGPFTLFAPSNDAFAALSPEFANQLLIDDNFIPQLQDLLLLHIISGRFLAADLAMAPVISGFNGEQVVIKSSPLTVNDNNVVDGDNIVSNGVVHVIDGVLIPIWVFNSLADRVFADTDLSILFSLLVLASIDLSGPSALTVVGPTNDAFGLLDSATVTFLTSPEGLADLTRILLYHVFSNILTSSILVDGFVQTLEGGVVAVSTGPPLKFNQATAVELDILANNGVLFKINQVLDPNDSPI